MKESITYTFLLNIILVFVFTCFAIVMGLMSYFKAFKANSIILNEIEKYEGYNCLSKESIEEKLKTIGYQTPFKVSCKKSDGKCDDSGESYKVLANNLDFEGTLVYKGENMNSVYKCNKNGCATNKHYQYGVYTYMYVDLPVVSNIIKIPFYSKTSMMYDFRNYYVGTKSVTDVEEALDLLYEKNMVDGDLYVKEVNRKNIHGEERDPNHLMGDVVLSAYAVSSTGGVGHDYIKNFFYDYSGNKEFNNRNDAKIQKLTSGRIINAVLAGDVMGYGLNGDTTRRACGYEFDYSEIKIGG